MTTPTTADTDDEGDGYDYSLKWKGYTAIAISFVTSVASMSMVFVALSAIADDFGITLSEVTWVVIVQALVISALMLPMGRLGDVVGRRKIHLIGLVVFSAGALAVAFAPTFELLIAARVVMATGNSMGQSVGTAMVVSLFPPEERGKAIGAQTTAVAIGGASGPIIAGLSLQILPWEALFIGITIPIAIAFMAGVMFLDEDLVSRGMDTTKNPFDWVGAIVSSVAIVVLVITINNPFELVWTSFVMIASILAVVALFTVYARWELRTPFPMLDLRLFSISDFRTSVGARIIGFMGSTASMLLIPVYLISLRGISAAAAGGIMFLRSAGMGLAAPLAGNSSDNAGTRPFNISGFALLSITTAVTLFFTASTPIVIVMVTMFFSGVSHGLWNVPNNSNIIGAVPVASYGVIGAFTNLTRNVGNVFGQAIASAIVASVMLSKGFDIPLSDIADSEGAGDAFTAGWRVAFGVALGLSVIGLGFAFRTSPAEPK
ncbi:MAG: MFS transporter [Actinomycetota bacterium]|nr:MFS transporter [Actinomycetota bacterium]